MTYPDSLDLETPEADAVEQATSARLEDDTDDYSDVDDSDRVVELEDEYR
jgi:hypothetical protein